jgi:hypothetical protein
MALIKTFESFAVRHSWFCMAIETSQLGQQTKASVSVFLDPIAFVWLTKPGREKIT